MENFKKLVSEELSYIDNEINKLVIAPQLDSKLNRFLNASDKRIRSLILFLYLKSQNIEITKDILDISVATEIIHNASLLQDDIIDDSKTRRGLSTLACDFSPKLSILVGDSLLTEAINKLLGINNPKIFKIFLDSIKRMSSTEITQFFNRGNIPSKEEYISICQGKTASLFEALFTSSAILLNRPKDQFQDFAKHFGIVYQINNDLQPDSEQNDLENNIYTAKKVLGIENTKILTHNYLEKLRYLIRTESSNQYQRGLKELLDYYEQ